METLIVDHLPLVRHVLSTVLGAHRLPPSIDREDLESMGRLALVETAQRFDPTRGAAFKTYAWPRVYGAMVDAIRKSSPLSRTAWKRVRAGDLSVSRFYFSIDEWRDRGVEFAVGADTPDVLAHVHVQRALHQLPARDAKVLELYFVEGWNLEQIAAHFGVCQSRASQLKTRAVAQLRDRLFRDGVMS